MKNTHKKKKQKKKRKNELTKAKRNEKKKEKKKEQLKNSGEERKKKGQKLRLALTSGSFHVCLITKIEFKCVFSFHNSSLKNQRIE